MPYNKQKIDNKQKINPKLVQIMTISLFILLLSFFILLNSIANFEKSKQDAVYYSVHKSFGGEGIFESNEGPSQDQDTPGMISPIDFSALAQSPLMHKGQKKLSFGSNKEMSYIRISASVLFDAHKINLKQDNYKILDTIAKIIQKNNYPVEITGHTNNIQYSDKFSNKEISAFRALAILKYFTNKHDIDPKRFTALGWGSIKPALPNTTYESRQINQRIEIAFMHDKQQDRSSGGFIFKHFFFKIFED